MNELNETVVCMLSNDYKERFKAEYYQTKIRYNKLHDVIEKYENKTLSFELSCPIELLKAQYASMYNYIFIMEMRAQIEGILLNEVRNNENIRSDK